ncbi:hypothetical protein E2C01_017030 [Portunus trituberculatus]|uniref:Uncharacterized protein n=1 Tax=Portunus trituberculatus TaxID=210409 RepID=A0A5B7DQR5_PORTR|nr:hypothetical protein [Portunus trituberculatus]
MSYQGFPNIPNHHSGVNTNPCSFPSPPQSRRKRPKMEDQEHKDLNTPYLICQVLALDRPHLKATRIVKHSLTAPTHDTSIYILREIKRWGDNEYLSIAQNINYTMESKFTISVITFTTMTTYKHITKVTLPHGKHNNDKAICEQMLENHFYWVKRGPINKFS